MPELTEQQDAFVKEYIRNGGKGADAARKAGFSEKSAGRYAWALMEKPHIQKAIQIEQRGALKELATISLGQARAMLEDPLTPAGARVDLIKTMLDRAGLVPPKDDAPSAGGKSFREMSLDELQAMVVAHNARAPAIDVTDLVKVESVS